MSLQLDYDEEPDAAGSMSFVFHLRSIIPRPATSEALTLHLYGAFPSAYRASIPFHLGRLQGLNSHRQEYTTLLKLKATSGPASLLPSIHETPRNGPRYNYYNHHRLSCHSPGVVRVLAKTFATPRSRLLSAPHYDRTMHSYQPSSPPKTRIRSKRLSMRDHPPESDKEPKIHYPNGDSYRGDLMNRKRQGFGVYNYKSLGLVYKGDWQNDKRHGQGSVFFRNGDTLQATWEDNTLTDTRVTMLYKSGDTYEGDLVDCERSGSGLMRYSVQATYNGGWLEDMREGYGMISGEEFLFEGTFRKGSTIGTGVLVHKRSIKDRTSPNSGIEPFADATMHEVFRKLTRFDFFGSMDLTSCDIVYMTLTSSQLKAMAEPPVDIPDGNFIKGELIGAGIAKYGGLGLYVGGFSSGQRSGWGKMQYTDPNYICLWAHESEGEYVGQWLHDMRQGYGTMIWANQTKYEGNFNKDLRHQVTGTMWFSTGEVYHGGWVDNLMHGFGTLTTPSGTCFKGPFAKGKAVGNGVLEFQDGRVYEGDVSMFEAHGKGNMVFVNGDQYHGQFVSGILSGQGKMKYRNGDFYEGMWANGLRCEHGVFYNSRTKERFEGYWKDNRREGFGRLTDAHGKVVYEGNWVNNAPEQ